MLQATFAFKATPVDYENGLEWFGQHGWMVEGKEEHEVVHHYMLYKPNSKCKIQIPASFSGGVARVNVFCRDMAELSEITEYLRGAFPGAYTDLWGELRVQRFEGPQPVLQSMRHHLSVPFNRWSLASFQAHLCSENPPLMSKIKTKFLSVLALEGPLKFKEFVEKMGINPTEVVYLSSELSIRGYIRVEYAGFLERRFFLTSKGFFAAFAAGGLDDFLDEAFERWKSVLPLAIFHMKENVYLRQLMTMAVKEVALLDVFSDILRWFPWEKADNFTVGIPKSHDEWLLYTLLFRDTPLKKATEKKVCIFDVIRGNRELSKWVTTLLDTVMLKKRRELKAIEKLRKRIY